MRYKPKFCCHCGEKIERPSPSLTDSKMFCDVCKHDFVLPRAAPVVFASLMALVGVFGLGSLWRAAEKPPPAPRQLTAKPANTGKIQSSQAPPAGVNSDPAQTAPPINAPPNTPPAKSSKVVPPAKPGAPSSARTDVPVYFCGAETKKGTPCSRRVRGGGRCWQHQGLTALLPDEKLAVNQ